MSKLRGLLGVVVLLLVLGAGCNKPTGTAENNNSNSGQNQGGNEEVVGNDVDLTFSDPNTKVTFLYKSYLEKTALTSNPGNVALTFKKRDGKNGPIEMIYFSTKTKAAWQEEKAKADPKKVCESNDRPGCEKWDADVALYNKAISANNFDGYYALGANKLTINEIPFVTIVTYNIETQQFQTKYTAYINDTRITFVDPSTGGLEYGVPFQMTAKNRETVEALGKNLAKRQKIDDVKTRARADELYQIVSTVKISK